jgi:serine/threonine protein kinase
MGATSGKYEETSNSDRPASPSTLQKASLLAAPFVGVRPRSLSPMPESEVKTTMSLGTPSGLAARRNFKGKDLQAADLSISTAKQDQDSKQRRRKTIQVVERFTDLYSVGKEVMPSSHSGMQVIFATRKSDNLEVVIKVRAKGRSFCDREEENEWRSTMEFMLNLPETEGIAKVYEVLEDPRGYYVSMEKVAGQDLFETVAGRGVMPITEVKEVMKQLLKALKELHGRGCIHKDLKLENIMFERSPAVNAKVDWDNADKSPIQVKLIDFDTIENCRPETPKLARDVLGTDQYIAQEAYAGHYTPASDIFAAGVIGYRLLTSRFPFKSSIFNDEAGENWVGSPKMKEIREKLCRQQIDWTHRIFIAEPDAKDLLTSMLSMKECLRPTAEEALSHPWLSASQRRRSLPNL